MRTCLLSVLMLSVCCIDHTLAQAPEQFNYQAVLRDMNNDVLMNQPVGIEISIIQGSSSGMPVYAESFSLTTNEFGLISLAVGSGNVQMGIFSDIDWGIDSYSLGLAVDETGGTSYSTIGTTQLLSVPYALHAQTAANAFSGSYNDLTDVPAFASIATSGDYNDLTNRPNLATVATSGDFNDLINIPSLSSIPRHEWDDTSLRFENPDGTWGDWVDLQGERGVARQTFAICFKGVESQRCSCEGGGTLISQTKINRSRQEVGSCRVESTNSSCTSSVTRTDRDDANPNISISAFCCLCSF